MFNSKNVRDNVSRKLRILRPSEVTEEKIHELYAIEMADECESARLTVSRLRSHLAQVEAHHPKQGWVMVSRDQANLIAECVDGLALCFDLPYRASRRSA